MLTDALLRVNLRCVIYGYVRHISGFRFPQIFEISKTYMLFNPGAIGIHSCLKIYTLLLLALVEIALVEGKRYLVLTWMIWPGGWDAEG